MVGIGKSESMFDFVSRYFSYIFAFLAFFMGWSVEAMLSRLGPTTAVVVFSITGNLILLLFLITKWRENSFKKFWWQALGVMLGLILILFLPPWIPSSRVDKDKVKLALQYAYEWDNYRNSKSTKNEPDDWWRILDGPIIKTFPLEENQQRMQLGVY